MRDDPDGGGSAAGSAARTRLARAEELRNAGRLREALEICESLVREFPDDLAALHTLGLVQAAAGNHWVAHSVLSRAAMLDPYDCSILTNLAQTCLELGAPEHAARTLEPALAIDDDDAGIHCLLGEIYTRQQELERAAGCFEKALACDPDHGTAASMLGSCYRYMGRMEEATRAFRRAHAIDRHAIAPIAALCQMPVRVDDIDLLAAIDGVASDVSQSTAIVAFSKAALFHKLGRHAEAWDQMVQANATILARNRQKYVKNLPGRKNTLDRARRFAPRYDIRHPDDAETPVSLFILAPARSGKTTLELLLGALADVKRGYENPIVDRSVRTAAQHSGLAKPAPLTELPEELMPLFAENYRKELLARARGHKVFTNTHPGQIAQVGRLVETVPKSKFVFVQRDRRDVALRIYMKHFGGSNYYSCDIETIFEWLSWYDELSGIWLDKFPERCVTLRYEDLVSDPEPALLPLFAQCGLALAASGLPRPADDRGCSAPYAELIDSARRSGVA